MSYIGSPPSTQSFAPGTDTFNGDGTTVAFTLSRNVATVNDIQVVVNNVVQQPTAYTVSVSTLTFSAAPSSGTANIYVRYLSTNLQTIAPQQGSVYPSSLSTQNALYWDTSGNVGVGTTTPGTRVDAYASGTTSTILRTRNDTVAVYLDANSSYSYLNTFTNHPMLFGTNNTERMRIDSSGNVGVGTTGAIGNSRLNVLTGITAQDANTPALQLYNTGAGTNLKYWRIISSTAGAMIFETVNDTYTAGSEKMRIDTNGNLMVATPSPIQSTTFSVLSGTSTAGFRTTATAGSGIVLEVSRTSATGDMVYFRTSSTTLAGYITCPTGTTTSYASVSDYRLKENIKPMVGALDAVSKLKPCTYTWKSDGSDGQGFIAHELQAVVPDCVNGEKDAVNEDGSIKPQGIDTSFLVATLTAAIQEQQAMIEELKTKVAALEAR